MKTTHKMFRNYLAVSLLMAISVSAEAQWAEVGELKDGMAKVKDNNGKWFCMDKAGKLRIHLQ